MLKYHGHFFLDGKGACACCVGDVRKVSIDPTGTKSLRTSYGSTMMIKWRGVQAHTRVMLVDQDLLGLSGKIGPAFFAGGTKVEAFQRFFDDALNRQVLDGNGLFMRPFVQRAYEAGKMFGRSMVGVFENRLSGEREETIFRLAVAELQGIMEATSQKSVRAVANGLLHEHRAGRISRAINREIAKTGMQRSAQLVDATVMKAFSEGTLDVYEAAGVRKVGLLPETVPSHAAADARRRITPFGRAGARSRGRLPGLRTIQRIRKFEREIEEGTGGLVNVETAGDDRVCDECDRISNRGPYRINKARQLIPAHINCRCIFVPARS